MLNRHRTARARVAACLVRFRDDRRGGTAIEYALIAAILGTALISSIAPLTSAFLAALTWIAEAI